METVSSSLSSHWAPDSGWPAIDESGVRFYLYLLGTSNGFLEIWLDDLYRMTSRHLDNQHRVVLRWTRESLLSIVIRWYWPTTDSFWVVGSSERRSCPVSYLRCRGIRCRSYGIGCSEIYILSYWEGSSWISGERFLLLILIVRKMEVVHSSWGILLDRGVQLKRSSICNYYNYLDNESVEVFHQE